MRAPMTESAEMSVMRFPGGELRAAPLLDRWLAGERVPAPPELDRSDAALRVEQMVLRALAALDTSVDEAVQHARQASRAAYTESLPAQELLAYWALARVRRISGNPYAAARIGGALCRAAPAPWRPLVDWELVIAGGDVSELGRPPSEPAASWLRLCETAEGAEEAPWRQALATFQSMALPPPLARERDALVRGLVGEGVGELDALRRVSGALQESAARSGQTPAVWRLAPGAAPRLGWCVAPIGGESLRLMDEGDRVRALGAALAESGAHGAELGEAFERVYGFVFEPSVHDGVFRVLLHRLRGALEGVAEIEREGDRLRLAVAGPLRLPEPRSEPPFGDRILRVIAANPGKTARELAERSGTTVRAVQRALRLLVETGACHSERVGRAVIYAVEDTTFSEPTHFR